MSAFNLWEVNQNVADAHGDSEKIGKLQEIALNNGIKLKKRGKISESKVMFDLAMRYGKASSAAAHKAQGVGSILGQVVKLNVDNVKSAFPSRKVFALVALAVVVFYAVKK